MQRVSIRPAAWALASFGVITYLICVLWGLAVPGAMRVFLEGILPGFTWLTFGSFLLGLVESALYGLYVAVVLVPLYNYFLAREPAAPTR